MEHGRTALVTGASRGIGQGIALELAGAGYDLAISYRNYEEGALAVKRHAEALGRRCEIYQADFVDTAAPEKLLRAVEADFGAIDAAVMNGAYDNRRSILTATADWMETMAHQLYISQMLIAGAAARLMVRTKTRGALLFITSIHGRQANTNDFFYGGMKAAIERSCQSLAIELAPYGVRANCIAPGAINVRGADDTKLKYPYANLIPAGRRSEPEDIAHAAAFLLSDQANYITGQSLCIDGGMALPGQPEGWAEPHPVDFGFVKAAYEQMMKNEEERNHV